MPNFNFAEAFSFIEGRVCFKLYRMSRTFRRIVELLISLNDTWYIIFQPSVASWLSM